MIRRSFLKSFLALFAGTGAAAALPRREIPTPTGGTVTVHPGPPLRYGELDIADYGYAIPYMAPHHIPAVHQGHIFRCENGHPLCEALTTIKAGDERWDRKVGNWHNGLKRPKLRDPFPDCPLCGSKLVMWRSQRGINV